MKPVFRVAYDIVTQESAEHGDTADAGMLLDGATLRDALAELHRTRTVHVGGVESIEPDSCPCTRPRSIRVINSTEFLTGACESRTLFIPENVTAASARRIARLAGVAPHYLKVRS